MGVAICCCYVASHAEQLAALLAAKLAPLAHLQALLDDIPDCATERLSTDDTSVKSAYLFHCPADSRKKGALCCLSCACGVCYCVCVVACI